MRAMDFAIAYQLSFLRWRRDGSFDRPINPFADQLLVLLPLPIGLFPQSQPNAPYWNAQVDSLVLSKPSQDVNMISHAIDYDRGALTRLISIPPRSRRRVLCASASPRFMVCYPKQYNRPS
jgi:hypothetical protein